MPLYSYKCSKCGHEFDRHNHYVNDASAQCPKCKATAPQKLTVFSTVLWKGGHWNKGG